MSHPSAARRASVSSGPRRVEFICDFYYAEVHAGVVDYARKAGWSLYDGKCYDVENAYTESWDGILSIVVRPRLVEWLKTQACPVVRLLSLYSGGTPFPVVAPNPETIGLRAAEHFLSLGAPNCVFYNLAQPDGREAGWQRFEATLRAAGRSVHRIDFAEGRTLDQLSTITREDRWAWLADRLRDLQCPLAAFIMDDRYVNDLVQAASLLGWQIPEDMAVLGADNRPLILGKQPMAISSVDANLYGVGWAGAELLDRIMQGEEPPAAPVLVEPGQVLARRSTATFVCDHPGVVAAMNFIRCHYHEPIQIVDIARAVRISARALQIAFKSYVGHTIKDEIVRLRLEHAARLLRETDLKLESIASESGLNAAKYLCHVFRGSFGTTPSEYREEHRHGRLAF